MKKIFLLFGVFLFITPLFADIDTNNQAKDLFFLFKNSIDFWLPKILQVATWLFWAFVTIDWVLTFGYMALKGTDFAEIFGEFIRKVILIGFFMMFFTFTSWLNTIPQSFSQLADIANGTSISITVDSILEEAVNIFWAFVQGFSITNLVNSLALFFCALISAVLLAYIGGRLFVVQLSLYIKITLAPLIFSLAGLTQTRQMAVNPFFSIIKGGFELFLLKLFLGLSLTIFIQFSNEVQPDLQSAIMVVLVPILIAMLITNIPSIVESLLSGSLASSNMRPSGTMAAAGLMGGAAGATLGFVSGAAGGAIGAKSAINAAKDLSAAGEGTTFKNLRKAAGADTVNSITGANKYAAGNKGVRMANSMNQKSDILKASSSTSSSTPKNDFQDAIKSAKNESKDTSSNSEYISGVSEDVLKV
jgi:type IV secretion system protein TrbL